MWRYRETGAGRPLVLLHGIGMSHAAWDPVTPYLQATRRVIAFDIAGFGATPPLTREKPPTVPHLVEALVGSIRAIGLDAPVDLAGNSLGGWMALEAARQGFARTVVAISPAGLWRTHDGRHVKHVFRGLRFMSTRFPNLSKAAMHVPWLRELVLAVPISPGSRHMPRCDARRAVSDLSASTAFEETFDNTRSPFPGGTITAPVTVAFGDRDWILTHQSRQRDRLPAHTAWVSKRGWGHVPMWVDPAGVAQLILDGTR